MPFTQKKGHPSGNSSGLQAVEDQKGGYTRRFKDIRTVEKTCPLKGLCYGSDETVTSDAPNYTYSTHMYSRRIDYARSNKVEKRKTRNGKMSSVRVCLKSRVPPPRLALPCLGTRTALQSNLATYPSPERATPPCESRSKRKPLLHVPTLPAPRYPSQMQARGNGSPCWLRIRAGDTLLSLPAHKSAQYDEPPNNDLKVRR